MRLSMTMLACCACVMLTGVAARASTLQWSVLGTNPVFIVMADGKGGCAITRVVDDPQGEIQWVDSEGIIIYRRCISNMILGAVLDVTPDHLLYADGSANKSNVVIHVVDKEGVDTALPAAADTVNRPPGPFPFSQTRMDDKKGFFVVRTQTTGPTNAVMRFSNK